MLEGYVHEVWETLLGAMKKKDILENEKKNDKRNYTCINEYNVGKGTWR